MSKPRPRTESELVELVRSSEVSAPQALHSEVQALISSRTREVPDSRRPSLGRGLLTATALAAMATAVLAIALSAGGGATQRMSLREASAPTLRTATAAAPPQSAEHRSQLAVAVDGVPFPYWADRFGWRSTGTRSDRIDGHTMTTVFYTDARGDRIGYAIVAGAPPRVSGGVLTWREQARYRVSFENGAPVVMWLRDGHMCVMSGRGVSSATLLRLASWDDGSPSVSS
jgi:hypothetical protein